MVEKHVMLYSPCIETVDDSSKQEWGRDAVWAQPCSTSPSTSWQKLWTAPAASRASLYTTLKSNACCMRTTWFWCPPQPRVSSTSLALLEQYCEEWALTVNLDKTRVMVFQKKARSQGSRYQFSYGGEVLEHSTSYSYLGIQISASGGFSLAVKALYEKARRAFYAIKSRFGQLKLPIKTWVKLYHAIIKQILLYGSEIWGPVIHFKNWDKTSIEKLQLEIIKNILGVHRSTSNDARRAELGLYPLKIEIQKRCVQFWHHLHQSDPDSIQYKALLANETSAESHPLN